MIDFNKARVGAFEIVENTRTVLHKCEEIKNYTTAGPATREYWLVTVEVPVENRIRDFILEISLKYDFPISLPTIKLSEADYEETKYLPHLDSDRNICLYDLENIKQNTDDPAGIINECVNQAVRVLSNGLNKDRVPEFNDEVIAYWENTYQKNDVIIAGYLGSDMQTLLPGSILAHYLIEPHANVNLYLTNPEDKAEKLSSFFKLCGHTIENIEAFYLGKLKDLNPPFYFDNNSLLSFIKMHFNGIWKDFKTYLNRNSLLRKFIFFSVISGGKPIFFGFYLHAFKTKFKGWREGQSAVQIMSGIRRTDAIIRVRFTEFYPERLQSRTDGQQYPFTSKKVMLAGLGSIGSYLLFYLSSLDISKYVLVDPELLLLENINRHLLSFNEVGMKKVDAIARYIKLNNPFVDIQEHPYSIVDIIQHRLSEINELDLIFCAIGKDAIESYILQHLATSNITKPVLFFWVEPYLLGAHVLYVNPGTAFTLSDLEIDGVYKFNILAKETYKDPNKKLALREAGCQGSYMPYGKAEIIRFFAALTPYLFDFIEHPSANNLAVTYVGDLNTALTLDLPISSFAKSLSSRQILIQSI